MRTDGEIKRLSEMPADSIAAATTNRTSARPAGSSAVRLHHFRKHTEGDHGRSWHLSAVPTAPSNVGFSNRPFRVKRFQTIHHYSVDVAHGLVLLFGIGTRGPSIMGFEDEVEQSIGPRTRLDSDDGRPLWPPIPKR